MAIMECFKCDVCGALKENGKPYLYVDCMGSKFLVKDHDDYPYSKRNAETCSDDCVKALLDAWLKDRQRAIEAEPVEEKRVVLNGHQPN